MRWGWHQLDDRWAQRLVDDAGISPGDVVLDIGAGNGSITAPLVAVGARVVAIELHRQRAVVLRARFGDGTGVRVVRADASDLRLPRRPFRVVANPPFAASQAVLRRLVAPGSRLERADLVLPAWLAHRWASGRAPGHRRWVVEFDLHVGRAVPPSAFRPAPPCRTAVLVIARRRRARRDERGDGSRRRGPRGGT
jgi:23S rRNA (adenine-N6)-dimethyltransferase